MLKLYHGSGVAVPRPQIELCRPHNDYGRGFYCTRSIDLAKEWACQQGIDGFVSAYELDVRELAVIDLNASGRCILHWLAVLLEHRLCRLSTPVMQQGAAWLAERFSVDISQADIVRGYRADDSYFGFARAFLRNEITLPQLSRAMRLGELGEQYMVRSPRGFVALRFAGSEAVDSAVYWTRREIRDKAARDAFQEIVSQRGSALEASTGGGAANMPPLFISTLMAMSEEELHACLS